MSYILSALRKAESERKPSETPTAESFLAGQQPGSQVANNVASKWTIGVLSMLLVATLSYVYLARQPGQTIAVSDSAEINDSVRQQTPVRFVEANGSNTDGQKLDGPASAAKELAPQIQVDQQADFNSDNPGVVSNQTSVEQVPPMLSLNITGYIYFEADPARSKLFVDGIVYRQGSRLGEGLTLQSFAKEFVTVSYFGAEQRVAIP